MGHWCNWPLVVWAFIAIFLLSSLWFMWNNCVWQLPASYTSTASNIRKRPITPGLLYIIHILGSKPLFCTNTLGRGREQHVMCVVEIETVFVKYLISVRVSLCLSPSLPAIHRHPRQHFAFIWWQMIISLYRTERTELQTRLLLVDQICMPTFLSCILAQTLILTNDCLEQLPATYCILEIHFVLFLSCRQSIKNGTEACAGIN